jgi:hypothetical protein
MATPVFKFQHPDLPSEDLYFIHNTFFELPETIPMDLSTFIWYHINSPRTLEGFFAAWDNLNKFQTSLKDESFDKYFDKNQKQQIYDDAIFGQSLEAAQVNQRVNLELKEFIDLEKYKTESISNSLCKSVGKTNYGVIKLSFFYSRHYFMQYIWDNFNNKLDESYSYMSDREIILALINFNGLGLSFASENLKKDREILLKAIKNDFRAFYFVDNSLKENKTFILEVIKTNYWVCSLLNEKLKKDDDILFETAKQECLFFFEKEIEIIEDKLQEVHDEDCNQESIDNISNGIENSLMNIKEYAVDGPFFFAFEFSFSHELLKNDEDYVLNLFKLWPHYLVDYNIFYSVASLRLLQSKEFITELLKSETKGSVLWSWQGFPTFYWSDKEFVKAAIKINGDALQYANDICKKDKEVVIEALKSSKSAIQFIDESLKNDEDVLALISDKFSKNIEIYGEDEELPF